MYWEVDKILSFELTKQVCSLKACYYDTIIMIKGTMTVYVQSLACLFSKSYVQKVEGDVDLAWLGLCIMNQ